MMARDALTDIELHLKKTARRRLVGAITLVVVMLIVLPFVLKDRAIDLSQEDVQITVVNQQRHEPIAALPADESAIDAAENDRSLPEAESLAESQPLQDSPASSETANVPPVSIDKPAATSQPPVSEKTADKKKPGHIKAAESKPVIPQATATLPETPAKVAALETAASKPQLEKVPASATAAERFYVQYGVFSDPKNLTNLHDRLKQAGFDSQTEQLDAQGQKLRLRSKVYANRTEAQLLLKKVEAAGFSGMVAIKS